MVHKTLKIMSQRSVGTYFQVRSGKYFQQPSPQTESLTLLMCAASMRDVSMVEILLKAGEILEGKWAQH